MLVKKEAKAKFIGTFSTTPTSKEKSVTLDDLSVNPHVCYIGLFINGNDVDGLHNLSWTKPVWDQLVPLMKQLEDRMVDIKNKPNQKLYPALYLCDEDDNNEIEVDLPECGTDSFGNYYFMSYKFPRSIKTLDDICLVAFKKLVNPDLVGWK